MGEEVPPFEVRFTEWEYGRRRRSKRSVDTVTGFYILIYYNRYYRRWMIWLWSPVRGFIRHIARFYICLCMSGSICTYDNPNKNIVLNAYKCFEVTEELLNRLLGTPPPEIERRPRLFWRWVRSMLEDLDTWINKIERTLITWLWNRLVTDFGWQVQYIIDYAGGEVRSEPYYSAWFSRYFMGVEEWCRCDIEGKILRNTCRYQELPDPVELPVI